MPEGSEWWEERVVPERESLGRYLSRLREEKARGEGRDVRQKDVADAVGVGMTAVGRWESGSSIPEGHTIYLLADFFGVSHAEFEERLKDELFHRQVGPRKELHAAGLPGPSLAVPDRAEVREFLSVLQRLDWADFPRAAAAVRDLIR